jgi:phage tail protein X
MNRYQNIPKTKINKKLVYRTSRYPEVLLSPNDIYVYTTQGDRFDTLAQQYYSDSSLWWVISIANTDKVNQSTIVIPEGLQIRIPSTYANIIQDFNIINA